MIVEYGLCPLGYTVPVECLCAALMHQQAIMQHHDFTTMSGSDRLEKQVEGDGPAKLSIRTMAALQTRSTASTPQ